MGSTCGIRQCDRASQAFRRIHIRCSVGVSCSVELHSVGLAGVSASSKGTPEQWEGKQGEASKHVGAPPFHAATGHARPHWLFVERRRCVCISNLMTTFADHILCCLRRTRASTRNTYLNKYSGNALLLSKRKVVLWWQEEARVLNLNVCGMRRGHAGEGRSLLSYLLEQPGAHKALHAVPELPAQPFAGGRWQFFGRHRRRRPCRCRDDPSRCCQDPYTGEHMW